MSIFCIVRRPQNLKKCPICFVDYSLTSKQITIFFQIFVALSENLNLAIFWPIKWVQSAKTFCDGPVRSSNP